MSLLHPDRHQPLDFAEEVAPPRHPPFPALTLALLATAGLLALAPAALLEYDRTAIRGGELWRLYSGLLVFGSVREACLDLGLWALFGCLLELAGERAGFAMALAAGFVAGSLGLYFGLPDVEHFRGGGALAMAFLALAGSLSLSERHPLSQAAGLLALALLVVRLALAGQGQSLLASGAQLTSRKEATLLPFLGVLAGVVAFWALALVWIWRDAAEPPR